MARLVDPILADLQAEYHEAVARGLVWRSRLAWVRAVVALVRAGTVHSLLVRPYEERRHVSRALLVTFGVFVGCVALLCAPFAWSLSLSAIVYIVPNAIPIAIPAGLVCGIVFGLGQTQHRLRSWVVAVSVVASAMSWYVMDTVVPASRHAAQEVFRTQAGRGRPIVRASNASPRGIGLQHAFITVTRQLGFRPFFRSRYSQSALACAPLVLVACILALTLGRRRLDVAIGLLLLFGYLGSLRWADLVYESQMAKAWAPNSILLVLTTGSLLLRWQRAKRLVAS
jgi:hypothetical protein